MTLTYPTRYEREHIESWHALKNACALIRKANLILAEQDVRRFSGDLRRIADAIEGMAVENIEHMKRDEDPCAVPVERADKSKSCFNCQFAQVKYHGNMAPPDVSCRLTKTYMHAGRFNCPHFVRRK